MSTHTTASQPKDQQFPGNCTLEKALEAIVNIFHQYSIREGQLDLLNFSDFQTLLTEQAPNFLSVCVSVLGRGAKLRWSWGCIGGNGVKTSLKGCGPSDPGTVGPPMLIEWLRLDLL